MEVCHKRYEEVPSSAEESTLGHVWLDLSFHLYIVFVQQYYYVEYPNSVLQFQLRQSDQHETRVGIHGVVG